MQAPMKALAQFVLRNWVGLLVAGACCTAVFVWLGPGNILSDTTPTGGDMGAHVWGPAYLRDELLPNWQIRGWTIDWYAGFPAFQFYMVLPYLIIVAVDVIFPYAVAFKLVAVSGVVLLPAAAWTMGRLARLNRPLPELFAVAALLFAFQINFTIYGGNIASTLAGEFAFSMALCATFVYLGLFWRTLETGMGRGRTALALAVVVLLHPIPLAFAIACSVLIVAVRALHRLPELIGKSQTALAAAVAVGAVVAVWNLSESATARLAIIGLGVAALVAIEFRRTWWALTIGLVGGAVSAFWSYPFLARRSFLNDMGWEKITAVRTNLFFPAEEAGDTLRHSITWLLVLASAAALYGLIRWQRHTLTWIAITATMGLAFVHWPQHRLWNARILPFWYLGIYFLAAIGVWVLVRSFALAVSRRSEPTGTSEAVRTATPLVAAALALIFVALYLGILPNQRFSDGEYRWGPLAVDQSDLSIVQGWANWNFTGYERRSGYPTYFDLVEALDEVGQQRGCGSVLWEYGTDELTTYGTPMAPMLLPHWTQGCIASMEGLYFESSPTVPFHFLMQSELSLRPSRAMRNLPYSSLDLDLGVAHLQMSGVRYYAAFTDEAIQAANQSADLTEVATAPPWVIYEVANSQVVEPLRYQPAVAIDAPQDGRSWTDPAVVWFNDRARWDVLVAADGPADWERVPVLPAPGESGTDSGNNDSAITNSFTRFGVPSRTPLPAVEVTEFRQGTDTVSFSVDRTGVPVLVKVSYFPNWSVSGADGPYRVTPNWMVVVPTSENVELRFAATGVEYTAWVLTLLGIILLGLMAIRPPSRFDKRPARISALTKQDESGPDQPVLSQAASGEAGWVGSKPAVSVVLPAYEAAGVVESSIQQIRAALAGSASPDSASDVEAGSVEIIVVDDGSSDGTAQVASKAGADQVISLEANQGKGAAVRAGMLAASGDVRIFTDVDLAYPPQQLQNVIAALRDADVAVGNRRHKESQTISSTSRSRSLGSRMFNLAARLALLGNYRDTQCGLKGFSAAAAELIFSQTQVDGFAFDVEVLYLAEQAGLRIVDVPVQVDHAKGSSTSSVKLLPAGFEMLKAVVRMRHSIGKGKYRLDDGELVRHRTPSLAQPSRSGHTGSSPSLGEPELEEPELEE